MSADVLSRGLPVVARQEVQPQLGRRIAIAPLAWEAGGSGQTTHPYPGPAITPWLHRLALLTPTPCQRWRGPGGVHHRRQQCLEAKGVLVLRHPHLRDKPGQGRARIGDESHAEPLSPPLGSVFAGKAPKETKSQKRWGDIMVAPTPVKVPWCCHPGAGAGRGRGWGYLCVADVRGEGGVAAEEGVGGAGHGVHQDAVDLEVGGGRVVVQLPRQAVALHAAAAVPKQVYPRHRALRQHRQATQNQLLINWRF